MKTALSLRKILITSTLLFVAFVIITSPAGASPAILPVATFSSVRQPATIAAFDYSASASSLTTQPTMDTQNPPVTSDDFLAGSQPLGNLVAIDWDELDVPGDHTFLSNLLNLPSYNESWTQFISRAESSSVVPDTSPISGALHQEICPSEVLCIASLHPDQAANCNACHNSSLAGILLNSVNSNQQHLHPQANATPSVDCRVCHLQKDRQASTQIRGVE